VGPSLQVPVLAQEAPQEDKGLPAECRRQRRLDLIALTGGNNAKMFQTACDVGLGIPFDHNLHDRLGLVLIVIRQDEIAGAKNIGSFSGSADFSLGRDHRLERPERKRCKPACGRTEHQLKGGR